MSTQANFKCILGNLLQERGISNGPLSQEREDYYASKLNSLWVELSSEEQSSLEAELDMTPISQHA